MKRILIMITCGAIVPVLVTLLIVTMDYDSPKGAPEGGIGELVFYSAPIILIILAVLGTIVSDKLTGPKN